jgi:hypothetical protein
MTATEQIYDELRKLYSKRESRELFLASPQAILDGGIPSEMIEAGRGREVLIALRAALDGTYL